VVNLCKGLRTNSTLKQLHLQFCNLSSASGPHLADVLANSRSALELFNISGNRLGGQGLASLCAGLMHNTKCETICLADNMIDQVSGCCYFGCIERNALRSEALQNCL